MSGTHTKFYRDKQNGKWMGVCAGIADYTGVDPLLVRIGMIVLTFITSGSTLPFYFLVGILADKKPADLYIDRADQQFWQGVRQSPTRTARETRSRFRDIDRRLAEIETYYTSDNRKLADEIESLR